MWWLTVIPGPVGPMHSSSLFRPPGPNSEDRQTYMQARHAYSWKIFKFKQRRLGLRNALFVMEALCYKRIFRFELVKMKDGWKFNCLLHNAHFKCLVSKGPIWQPYWTKGNKQNQQHSIITGIGIGQSRSVSHLQILHMLWLFLS